MLTGTRGSIAFTTILTERPGLRHPINRKRNWHLGRGVLEGTLGVTNQGERQGAHSSEIDRMTLV
jgi:hypothetical protein